MSKCFTVDSKVSLPEYEQAMKDVAETEFLILKPKNGGEVLVSRKRDIIFHWQHYESLYHMVDFYFVEARWVEVSVHRNDMDTSMQIKRTLGGRVDRDRPALEALLRVQAQRILANSAFKASALAPSSQEGSTEYTMKLKPGTTL
ncbi:uncharacterized protein LAESUDRAFT_761917 [Laetiporus sulphureus 93-53]|uniref:Uncharacterized protein n=1 Tax=Laetiporus sulphureus 93-53 TaxID=1314785 RepID=A0A165CWH1_9APHY|nr:uncharacterized protein LAESUDRAFT_761917 [Laetiporus sulphureus 93-53]KZT03587.1 hypothetical protein LAESUDRAFT_761917 [Laetiporus sulphureus 93-53]